jgi:hypothetical protein
MPSRKRQDQTGNGSPNLNSLKSLRLALAIFPQALANMPFFRLVPIAQALLYGRRSIPADLPRVQISLCGVNLTHQLRICFVAVFECHDTQSQPSKQVGS